MKFKKIKTYSEFVRSSDSPMASSDRYNEYLKYLRKKGTKKL